MGAEVRRCRDCQTDVMGKYVRCAPCRTAREKVLWKLSGAKRKAKPEETPEMIEAAFRRVLAEKNRRKWNGLSARVVG